MNVQFEGDKVIISKVDFMDLIAGTKISTVSVKEENLEPNTLESDITDYLDQKGFKRNIKGFRYLRCAIESVINNPELLSSITKELYPMVAEEFDTTPSRVERAIRHSIEVAFVKDKPCNSEFIAYAADEIRLKRKG